MRINLLLGLAFCFLSLPLLGNEFTVQPNIIELSGKYAQTQVIVTELIEGKVHPASQDATSEATYISSDMTIVTVDSTGLIQAQANGTAEIRVALGQWSTAIAVTVAGVEANPQVDFDFSVRPILSKAGCNMGACHASQHGKGGFILSVFGFDSRIDYKGIVKDELERRVDFIQPTNSLFLLKPTMKAPHGGGRRLKEGTMMYNTLVDW